MTDRIATRRRLARAGTVLVAALALPATPSEAQRRDLRSLELIGYDCRTELGGRDLTLFANGTVRVRMRSADEPRMVLKELSPGELDGYLNRLREIDLSEAEEERESTTGEWVESCMLTLDLDAAAVDRESAAEPRNYTLGPYDSLSLNLSRAVGVVEEIFTWAQDAPSEIDIPIDYSPTPGDILRRHDGILFEVITFTSDQRGVELWGVEQPLVVYVLVEEVIGEFVELVEDN